MKVLLKKVIALFLFVAMLFNSCFSNCIQVKASELNASKTIYLDGVRFDISFDDDLNMIILGQALESDSEAELVLHSDGIADVVINNEGEKKEDYIVDISELDYEKDVFEAEVYDTQAEIVEEYHDLEDLEEELVDYEGQVSITVDGVILITIALVLSAMIAAGTAKIISDVVYIVADVFYDAVQSLSKTKRAKAYKYYYPAYISGKYTLVSPRSISLTKAAKRIKNDLCVYSFTSSKAREAVTSAGYSHWPAGTTGDLTAKKSRKSGGVYFYHFHKATTKGHGKEHSFYGTPIIG